MKASLILLTLNEIEGVRHIYPQIPQYCVSEILVIDGGSTDGTIEYFRDRDVRVLVQQKRGRGEAFRMAYREAVHAGLIFFSPDGNEDPNDIPRLLSYLQEGFDMVIGSRFMPGGRNEEDDKLFAPRKWANVAFTWVANALWNTGGYITDTINGYRAITKRASELMNPDAEGYAIEYQMSIRAMKLGLRVKEIPTIEYDRIGGASKAIAIPTGIKFLCLIARELWLGRNFQTLKT